MSRISLLYETYWIQVLFLRALFLRGTMPVRSNYKIKDCAKTFSLRRDIDMKINRTDTGDILLTRMKTSISSKAFCSITDGQTDKIFTEQILIYEGNLNNKKLERYLNQGPRKSRFPLNVVDIWTDGRTFAFIEQLCY